MRSTARHPFRFWAVLTTLLVGGCVARASVGPAPSSATSAATVTAPTVPPTSADGCKACNGMWGRHGLADTESCNCRTTDAGKRCKDGAECQGVCVAAEEPEREVVVAGPPARGYFVGKCSETVTVFGCFKPIDKGAASHGPVPMADPPPSLCVD